MPRLESYTARKETLLAFNGTTSGLLERSHSEIIDDGVKYLSYAAKIIRRDIDALNVDSTHFSQASQENLFRNQY